MTDFLLLIFSMTLIFLGNKAFNISTKNIKQTDPPSDFSQVEKPELLVVGFALFLAGCWVFWLFLKTQM
jgi:hypothetical protein